MIGAGVLHAGCLVVNQPAVSKHWMDGQLCDNGPCFSGNTRVWRYSHSPSRTVKEKGKERKSIYIAPFCTKVHTKRSGMDHTVLPANNTMPAFPSWAFTRWHHHNTWGSRHPIAAYYSFIDPERMKGWVAAVDDLQFTRETDSSQLQSLVISPVYHYFLPGPRLSSQRPLLVPLHTAW